MAVRIQWPRLSRTVGLMIGFMVIASLPVITCEVPDGFVYTDLHKTARKGDELVLKCEFYGTPFAVYWKKGDDPLGSPNLITWVDEEPLSGPCVQDRSCDIGDDFSLIINDIQIADQGRYICLVSNHNGILIDNFTDVAVFAPPSEPYPTLNGCQLTSPNNNSVTCTMATFRSVNITCSALGYFPDIDLFFLHGFTNFYTTNANEVTNPDVAVMLPLCAFIVVVLSILFRCRRRGRKYELLPSDQRKDAGPVSYLELWELIVMCDIVTADQIVSKLVNSPERDSEFEFVRTKTDLYRELCEWKEESSGDLSSLYGAMDEIELFVELNLMKDFRGLTDNQVSDDDLEHVCWHVHRWRETVQPILRVLYHCNKSKIKLTHDTHIPISSRCDVIKDDLQLMKMWKADSMSADLERKDGNGVTVTYRSGAYEVYIRDFNTQTTPRNKNSQSAVSPNGNQDEDGTNEETPIITVEPKEVDLKTKTTAPNQRVRFCLALEEAGEKADESDRRIYLQLAKTFFQIEGTFKRELTDDDFKKFALSITEPHCQRLGKTVRLSKDDITTRNEEDLITMFLTDAMLKEWVMKQECSNYEIRCRLREAAKRCNRQDIADVFIGNDQSQVMPSNRTVPTSLTVSNEKQIPQASALKSNASDRGTPSQPAPENGHVVFEERNPSDAQPTVDIAEADIDNAMAISRDELERIGRYAGMVTLLALGKKYGVTTVPGQQSPEGKELPFDTKIINVLKPVLDGEHDKVQKKLWNADTPTKVLRRLLQDKQPPYDCLLPWPRSDDIYSVELIELAFRLIMADVYPFAKALGITDQVLTSGRPKFRPKTLNKGTSKILQAVTTDDRFKMVRTLNAAGYSEEGKAIYFGFEISLGDVLEVENRVDKELLAKELDILNDNQTRSPDNQINEDECHQPVLLSWKDTVRSSTFNHRMVLADAVFAMGEHQLALDVISGVHRKRSMNSAAVELLGRTIPETQSAELSKVLLGKEVKEGQTCQGVITSWTGGTSKKKPIKLSNELLKAGFYELAYEIMAGAWQGKEDKKLFRKKQTHLGRWWLCKTMKKTPLLSKILL